MIDEDTLFARLRWTLRKPRRALIDAAALTIDTGCHLVVDGDTMTGELRRDADGSLVVEGVRL